MDDEPTDGYRWEGGYEKTWEVIDEDQHGSIKSAVFDLIHRAKRKKLEERMESKRLGILRHVLVAIDMSSSMMMNDFPPTRLDSVISSLESFVDAFFDNNPIAQLALLVTKDRRATVVCELTGNVKKLKKALRDEIFEMTPSQEPSLQNVLVEAVRLLGRLPGHTSRELIIVMSSLSTCDPGDIANSIEDLKKHKIQCSIVGLSAELQVCKRISSSTNGGEYVIAVDTNHLKDTLNSFALPPISKTELDSSLVKMGFPMHCDASSSTATKTEIAASMCICHGSDSKRKHEFSSSGYFCPQCNAKYCDVPIECQLCGLLLVTAPHLARSYHHLFPLPPFEEVQIAEEGSVECNACSVAITMVKAYKCAKCSNCFCIDCDVFIHETLHTCPGCASIAK